MNTNREQIAWAAGLFEGEGCISYQISSGYYFLSRLTLQSTDEDVVRRLHAIVEDGYVRGPLTGNANTKPYWEWRVTGNERVRVILEALLPWLGTRRTTKALEVIERGSSARLYPAGPRPCSADGCTQQHKARGLCPMHYQRIRRHDRSLLQDRPRYRKQPSSDPAAK